jgi:hypothetical protein
MARPVGHIVVAYLSRRAGKPGSLDELMKKWLDEAGETMAKLVNGSSRLAFKQGHVVVVTYEHPEGGVETIGLRMSTYKGTVTLHYVDRKGNGSEIDSMDLGQFARYTPDGLGKWAIATVLGKKQLQMFR